MNVPPPGPAGATPFVDLHAHWLLNGHFLGRPPDTGAPTRLPWGPLGNRVGLDAALRGGVHGLAFTVYDPFPRRPAGARANALAQLRTFHDAARASGGRLRPARTGADIRAAAADGVVAGIAAVEGGHSLGGDLSTLTAFADLGVRLLTLVHMLPNDVGDVSESRVRRWGGLSPFGRQVLAAMPALGVIPDVAHLSDDGVRQVLDLHPGPVVTTHTGLRALAERPRNLPDDLARGIARSGGVVGLILFPPFLDRGRPLRQSLDAFLDHACHAAWAVGPDHVAVGSDMDGWTWTPRGIGSHADWPLLAEGLSRRGFSPPEVAAILGGNALRVLDA